MSRLLVDFFYEGSASCYEVIAPSRESIGPRAVDTSPYSKVAVGQEVVVRREVLTPDAKEVVGDGAVNRQEV
jgi:hypothetical protein